MTDVMVGDRELVVVVDDDATEEEWHDARDEGVTASEIHAIASGSRKTWRRILDQKLNGRTFRGNDHTRRGHEREAVMLDEILIAIRTVAALAPSRALFAHPDHGLHRATPDALGIDALDAEFGVEMKSHDTGYTQARIPADHYDQMQWGLHVTGFNRWLYVWEVIGTPGITYEWVPRDENRIEQLRKQADEFIAWRAAGAPEIDGMPDYIDDAIANYAEGLAMEKRGKTLKAESRAVYEPWAEKQAAAGEPLRRNGSRAGVFYEPQPDEQVLDEDAWAAAEPEGYAELIENENRCKETREAARALYHRPKPVAPKIRVTPNGESA